MKSIPSQGRPHSDILKQMEEFNKDDANYTDARTWSLVYHLNDEHENFLKKAHGMYFNENALNPMAFKSL